MSKIIRLTESKLVKLIKDFINEDERHIQSLYKNWASNKSGNPDLANSLMGDFFKYQKSLPKKDFIQYKSADELKSVIDDVKKRIQDKQIEKEVDRIYEDNSTLVVMAKTWEASCKYGYGTKWCTASKDDSSYWKRHKSNGTEFIWINKKVPANNPYHKLSLYIKDNGTHDWCNSTNNCSRLNPYELGKLPQPKNYENIFNKCFELNNANLEDRKQSEYKILEENPIYIKFLEYLGGVEFEADVEWYSHDVIDEMYRHNYGDDDKLKQIKTCVFGKIESVTENIKEPLTNYMRDELINSEIQDDMYIDDIIERFGLDVQIREIIYELTEECFINLN